MRRLVSIVTTIGLGTALAAVVTASPGSAADPAGDLVGRSFPVDGEIASRKAGPAEQLLSATATFGPANRVAGMPTSTAPQHQFSMPAGSLSVTIDYGYHWETDALTYHYDLDTALGAPSGSEDVRTLLGFGTLQASSCTIEEATVAYAYTNIPDILLYDKKDTPDLASAAGWNCAVLLVDAGQGTQPYDAFVSLLDVQKATPQLTVKAPRRDRLVKKVWTRVPVTVANASPEGIDARDVAVVGAGKGVKVRPASFGALEGQDDSDGYVWARLTKPKATLKIAVTEKGEVVGRSKVKLRTRPAPAPPKVGSWTGGGADFTVRGGKVRGFRISTQTTCGGYPGIPTTTNNTYSFETTSIPRNNEVVGTEKGNQGGDAAYTAYLDLEFVSRTKAVGKFSYFGPARCTATTGFTARLKR
ncbi:hypothetical protein F4692_000416 [Nocardioides cavernae]|uniref:Uncharacterized protein n=1 Tax=Nocardioides cavernae TaxID=1921566 RepID=A0A7Y9GZT8_9ACTN|nr:hypothetical protein [Nocardioides cavernae]NYE35312.1 hypothetical protein [Nocardioides cavernae]